MCQSDFERTDQKKEVLVGGVNQILRLAVGTGFESDPRPERRAQGYKTV